MSALPKCSVTIKPAETMKFVITTFVGVAFGFFLGICFPTISLSKVNFPSSLFPATDHTYVEDKFTGITTKALLNNAWTTLHPNRENSTKIWIPTNPRGAERLAPGIIESESDLYPRRLWGSPDEDLPIKPNYLVTFTVGFDLRHNIDAAVKKFSENFTIMLFHYDGRTSDWEEFEWSKRAIHVSVRKQTKWTLLAPFKREAGGLTVRWYAKRFLHPDIVAAFDYIFVWDEDLGVKNFNGEEYVKLVKKYGLEISQPGLEPNGWLTWQMTKRRNDTEVHMKTEEREGWCAESFEPPCAAFVEIMATVFSRDAWRCVWHMIQNDLVHGWGLDFALRKCVEEPAHEKIGVVDAQWIVHQGVPSLGNQGQPHDGRAPWEAVRERCKKEWEVFKNRVTSAEKAYLEALGVDSTNLKRDENQKNVMD